MQRRRRRRVKQKHADSPAATTTSPKRLKGNDATPIPTRSQETEKVLSTKWPAPCALN